MVLQARTREQLRVAIGYNLGAVELITAAINGTTTTFLTDGLFGAADDHNGKWWLGTDTPNDGVKARVTDSSVASDRTTLTLHPAVSSTLLSDTAELWDRAYDPAKIHEFINQAIIDATGHTFDPEEDRTLFGDGYTSEFAIPTEFAMISHVFYRGAVKFVKIHTADAAWTAGGSVTASVDTKDKRQGTGSAKLVLAAGVLAGDVVGYKDITAINLSGMTHVEFWLKCTLTLTAGQLKLLLDNTAGCVSPLETINIPATTLNTWTYHRVALASPKDDTAIISVGIEDDVDIGAATVWIDDIRAVRDDSEVWEELPRHLWRVDREGRLLVLTNGGRSTVSYAPIKLVGGDKPALLSADADVCEIDDYYVIARATELALLSNTGPQARNPEANRQAALYWAGVAERTKNAFPFLVNARVV